ncbi:MAG TPA: hypothetical protein VEW93_12565 [Acidimicrobiales bacterium]|nr:hypothetical protein [Acidimicrobiales bacterium]
MSEPGDTRPAPAVAETAGDRADGPPAPEADPSAPTGRRRRPSLAAVGLWAVVVAPLAVAAVAMRHPRWYPIADLAQGELRVRDVGGRHTPLIGLAGRIGDFSDPGSHPGPLSFWALAPIYRLLGGSAWALVVSSVALHAAAIGTALWTAGRRAGLPLVAGVAAALALLVRTYGVEVFIEPWNPHLPVMAWIVFLLALWSVLDGDPPLLVVAVVAGSFCAQTHLPYLGLVGALTGFLAVPVALSLWPRWRARRAARAPGGIEEVDRGRLARWTAAAVVVGVALWTPTVLDELFGTGNVTKIRESLSDPVEPVTGFGTGIRQLLFQLDPGRLVGWGPELTAQGATRWNVAGTVLVLAWAAAAAGAWRLGHRPLLRLHAVLAAALALGWLSISRVYGTLWYYLFLWTWGLGVLMLLAVAWTGWAALSPRLGPGRRTALRGAAVGVAALVAVVAAGAFTTDTVDAEPSRPDLSATLGVVADGTAEALGRGEVVGGGRSGRYLVRWIDPVSIGSQGIGLVNELERAGFTVGVDEGFGAGAVRYRVLPEAEATAVVTLVVGPAIAEWQARPDADQVAYADERTPEERQEAEALSAEVDTELRAAGLPAVAEEWVGNLFTATLHAEVPEPTRDKMLRVLDIGAAVAVFVTPPTRS